MATHHKGGTGRSKFACEDCGTDHGDVRLVEHGYDDVALCKRCFKSIATGTNQEVTR